jgi:hypothetical protein
MLLRIRSYFESPYRANLDGLTSSSTISKSLLVPTFVDFGLLAALDVMLVSI